MPVGSIANIIDRPRVAYLFPELGEFNTNVSFDRRVLNQKNISSSDVFVFQFWPSQVQDSYEAEYATKQIPGGSNPLYQYISGSGRTISFEAVFTCEVDEALGSLNESAANSQVAALGLPSSRYTVDINGATAKLRSYQLPTYGNNGDQFKPPTKLHLVFPNTMIGGNTDSILCFLKSSRITYESWFPSGKPRVITMALEFVETVQEYGGSNDSSSIKFIDASTFKAAGETYLFKGNFDGSL